MRLLLCLPAFRTYSHTLQLRSFATQHADTVSRFSTSFAIGQEDLPPYRKDFSVSQRPS